MRIFNFNAVKKVRLLLLLLFLCLVSGKIANADVCFLPEGEGCGDAVPYREGMTNPDDPDADDDDNADDDDDDDDSCPDGYSANEPESGCWNETSSESGTICYKSITLDCAGNKIQKGSGKNCYKSITLDCKDNKTQRGSGTSCYYGCKKTSNVILRGFSPRQNLIGRCRVCY